MHKNCYYQINRQILYPWFLGTVFLKIDVMIFSLLFYVPMGKMAYSKPVSNRKHDMLTSISN